MVMDLLQVWNYTGWNCILLDLSSTFCISFFFFFSWRYSFNLLFSFWSFEFYLRVLDLCIAFWMTKYVQQLFLLNIWVLGCFIFHFNLISQSQILIRLKKKFVVSLCILILINEYSDFVQLSVLTGCRDISIYFTP